MSLLFGLVRSLFVSRGALVLENLALRQQLASYKRSGKRPRFRTTDRILWVWLSRLWRSWSTALIIVKPKTVIDWHRQGRKLYWRRQSRSIRPGRPTIALEHIAFIRTMSRDNPSWGETRSTRSCALSSACVTLQARFAST